MTSSIKMASNGEPDIIYVTDIKYFSEAVIPSIIDLIGCKN